MKFVKLVGSISITLCALNVNAASIDGSINIGSGEYQYSTEGAEGSAKWNTHGGTNEYNDGKGGPAWDIKYLGTSTNNGTFQFGAVGGQILSGKETGHNIFLGDLALSVGGHTNATLDSSGFEYAVRLNGVNDLTGEAQFSLFGGGTWEGANLYNNRYAPNHITDTYRMVGGTELTSFTGQWSNNGGNLNVLEGEFDLSFLSLLSSSIGGSIHSYLAMTCVNDEVLVEADVSAVPVPASIWLFGSVMLGFAGLKSRKKV